MRAHDLSEWVISALSWWSWARKEQLLVRSCPTPYQLHTPKHTPGLCVSAPSSADCQLIQGRPHSNSAMSDCAQQQRGVSVRRLVFLLER